MKFKALCITALAVIIIAVANFTVGAQGEKAAVVSGNNRVFSSDLSEATFEISQPQLNEYYYNSGIKYYTFNVQGLSVRADKNCFYDHEINTVKFTVKPREFSVDFIYKSGTSYPMYSVPLDITYTVTGADITKASAPVISGSVAKCESVDAGKMVFTSKALGAFSITNYEFSDVNNKNLWYYNEVNACAAMGILNGMGDGTFKPQNKITRAQLATMVVRALDDVIVFRDNSSLAFADVKQGSWYYDYVMKCAAIGIVNGRGDDKFCPEESATREEIATVIARVVRLINRYNGQPLPQIIDTSELSSIYPDAYKISWAKTDVLFCNKLQIMIGDATGFRPKHNITRAEAATIFYRLKNSLK